MGFQIITLRDSPSLRTRLTPSLKAGKALNSRISPSFWINEIFIISLNIINLGKMLKSAYHPKAFLAFKKNVHRGLANRTKIISLLEVSPLSARELSERTGLSYNSVLHHLHLLENERIAAKSGSKPYVWKLTGAGQQTLIQSRG